MVGLELGEEAFLTPPAIMEGEHLGGAETLVGEDDLELIAVVAGGEEIELDGIPLPAGSRTP